MSFQLFVMRIDYVPSRSSVDHPKRERFLTILKKTAPRFQFPGEQRLTRFSGARFLRVQRENSRRSINVRRSPVSDFRLFARNCG